MKRTARDILREKGGHMLTISSEATVYEAVSFMNQHRVGAILVVDESKQIVGIWTERDLMRRVVEPGFDPQTDLVRNGMTSSLISAHVDATPHELYETFVGRRIRHLLIEEFGHYVGILSARDVMQATLQQSAEEYRDLNEMVSMEYYENWKAQAQEVER